MAILAIKGHPTRGKEVIQTLEMLGYINQYNYSADIDSLCFYGNKNPNIICYNWVNTCYEDEDLIIFTLEEFIEKYPYKVGDKVQTIYGKIGIVNKPIWSSIDNCIRYELEADTDSFYFVNELQPYKEETMEETIIDTIKESNDRYRLHINYQYEIEVDEGEYYVVRRKPQYPKTYGECCKILKYIPNSYDADEILVYGYMSDELRTLQKLLICRDAYWKIAGEETGMDKPWEPDWNDEVNTYYTIHYNGTDIKLYNYTDVYSKLSFPSEEMRDTFFENFKELIEICKELL